jgi:hypothetical protein
MEDQIFATKNCRCIVRLCRALSLLGAALLAPLAQAMTVNYPDVPVPGASTSLNIDTTVTDTNSAPDIGQYPGAGSVVITYADGSSTTLSGIDLLLATTGNGTTTFIIQAGEGAMQLDLTGNFAFDAVNDLSGFDAATPEDFNGGSVVYDPDITSETPPTITDVGSGGVTVTPIPGSVWLLGSALGGVGLLRRRRPR